MSENPICENPTLVNPRCENYTQSSIQGNQKLKKPNTDLPSIHQSIRTEASEGLYGWLGKEPDVMDIYSEIIKENIDYEGLCEKQRFSKDEVEEIFELMLETVCTRRKTIRIGREDKPAELVKSRMLEPDDSHIDYVMDALGKNTTEIRNTRRDLLTSLFNAPNTIGNYYKTMVQHDLYGKK